MATNNISNLDTANTAARVAFEETLEAGVEGQYQLYTTEYSTGVENDDLVFMVTSGVARQWLGGKIYNTSTAYKQDVTLVKYEDSQSMLRTEVDYDSSGAVAKFLSTWVRDTMKQGTDKIVTDKLVSASGAGPTGFDSTSLLNTSHSYGGSTYSNKSTSALSFSTFNTCFLTMQGYCKANGEPLNITPTHLMVGPKLRQTAKEIVGSTDRLAFVSATGAMALPGSSSSAIAAAAIPNVFASDGVQLIVNPRLKGTQDDYWYAMDLSKADKPMLLKKERDWELIEATDMKDPQRFDHDLYVWSIEADMVAAAGAWPTIYGGII